MSLLWLERNPMDLEATLSTIAESLPQEISHVIDRAAHYFPEELAQVIKHASSYMPTEIDLVTAAQFLLYFSVASLILGVMGRVFLGKRSSLNHSLSAVMGILFIYAVTIVVYTFKPWNLVQFLSPLPFVTFSGEYLIIFPIMDAKFASACSEVLSMIILAFLVNLLDTFIPQGKSAVNWLVLRLISVLTSMVLHFIVSWAFRTYLPDVLVTYSPTLLLFVLLFMMLSGLFNLIFSLMIIMTNPFMGAMYTFFFSNIIGKQVTKAVFSTTIFCALVYILELFGYTLICITTASLLAYIPLIFVMLLLWYLVGHVL
jgi:hypothetical protein